MFNVGQAGLQQMECRNEPAGGWRAIRPCHSSQTDIHMTRQPVLLEPRGGIPHMAPEMTYGGTCYPTESDGQMAPKQVHPKYH